MGLTENSNKKLFKPSTINARGFVIFIGRIRRPSDENRGRKIENAIRKIKWGWIGHTLRITTSR